jgi:hypothetical protein
MEMLFSASGAPASAVSLRRASAPRSTTFVRSLCLLLAATLLGCRDVPIDAHTVPIEPTSEGVEGTAHGFPSLRSLDGERLAHGDFAQWIDGDRLHVRIRYDFGPQRTIEERDVLQQEPRLVQEQWSWTELRDGQIVRRFALDFLAGIATAEKLEDGELRRWSREVELEPGRSFAGSAFTLAIKGLRERLLAGETVELQTVGFTPKPRSAVVEVTHAALDELAMADRKIQGDRFLIHPKIPWIVRPFVDVPDTRIWLVREPPAAFLRWEGPLGEPDDPIVRVDLLPGDASAAAVPVDR